MTTSITNIEGLESVSGELTEIVKANSLAFQVCGIQHSLTTSPIVFGIKKTPGGTGFNIVKKEAHKVYSVSSEAFTEELVDDVFAIFGKSATDIFKTIAANDVANTLDTTIIDYMKDISTKVTDVIYDLSSPPEHKIIINNLLLKINKERVIMAKNLKRGLPNRLIVSGGVASLLITNKIISGNNEFTPYGKDNIKFIGSMGDMMVYHDFNAVSEYVMISHITDVQGDASVIIIPITEPKHMYRTDKETGQPSIFYTTKYAYSRNPNDSAPTAVSLTDAIFLEADDSINSVLTDLTEVFSPGDSFTITDTANNEDDFVIESVSANKIIVVGDVITAEGTGTATLTKTNSEFISSFGVTLTGFTDI